MKKKRRPQPRRSPKKKPKFLSLRLQFPPEETVQSETDDQKAAPDLQDSPMEMEEQADDTEAEKNVAFLFSEGDSGATSLNALLDGSAVESNSSQANSNTSPVGDFSPASYREERTALVRTAMRSWDRDFSREKWVHYSEVVDRKVKDEEVSSSAVNLQRRQSPEPENRKVIKGPLLKLDYDEIMNAWSNKGPLYIYSESSQIVPDINNDFLSDETSNFSGVSLGGNVGYWTVPEIVENNENGDTSRKSREEMMGQREASVLRYKEKRQSRLFCKKIRYQVRKLNAEKRPRIKGRFVKQS